MDDFWTDKQKQDIAYFNEHVEDWASDPLYKLKFVIISDREIKGLYDSFAAALSVAAVTFGEGRYIIQQIIPNGEIISFLSPALALA